MTASPQSCSSRSRKYRLGGKALTWQFEHGDKLGWLVENTAHLPESASACIQAPCSSVLVSAAEYNLRLSLIAVPVSGSPPTVPVVSKTSGTVYEKALIERYIGGSDS